MASDINFDRLERDLEKALEADKRYCEKNDAKFRAIHQRVATYEEFREIVNASHLKPLNKGERITEMNTREPGVWNRSVTPGQFETASSAALVKSSPSSDSALTPTTSQQFLRHWRSLKSSDSQYGYLQSLPISVYSSIFASEVPFGLLGQFVCAFDACMTNHGAKHVFEILGSLARCQRLRLAVEFFSADEKLAAARLMERLREALASTEETAEAVGVFDIFKLKDLYVRT